MIGLKNSELASLEAELWDMPRKSFKDLCNPDPLTRFLAARTIIELARSSNELDVFSIVENINADALNMVTKDPNWKVRRAAKAAVHAIADSVGPYVGVLPKLKQDPITVCRIIQAVREQLDIYEESTMKDFRQGVRPSTAVPVKLMN